MALRELNPPPREIPPDVAKQFRRRGLLWLILTFVSLPIGIIALTILYFLDDPFQLMRLEKNGVHITGRVTAITVDRKIHSGSAHPWLIHYTFRTGDGKVVIGHARTWENDFKRKHPAGGAIGVLYLPDNPSDNRPADLRDSMVPWYVYLIFGIELFVGIIFFLVYRGIVSGARSLFTDGMASTGQITSISEARYINIGRHHPFNIEYSFKDPNIGREYKGFVRSYSFKLAGKLEKGDEVTVVYDWENPERSIIVL